MKPLIKLERPTRFFYASNVNMSLSFDRLKGMAEKLLGAEVELGDVLICDNVNKTKRKVLQMTPTEAKELLEVVEAYHHMAGHRLLGSANLEKHLKAFLCQYPNGEKLNEFN